MQALIPTPYQLIHLMKLRSNGHNCLLIADGVGVGKTISSGYAIFHQAIVSRRPVLVVCPPILTDKWVSEMKTKFHLQMRRADNSETFELMIDEIRSKEKWDVAPVYITTYSVLSRKEKLHFPNLGMVVMDEVHSARNPETRLYPALKEICRKSQYRIGLSATPVNNSISDLASIMSLLMPKFDFKKLDPLFGDLWGLPVFESMSCITTRFTKDQVASHFTRREVDNIEVDYPVKYTRFVNEKISEMYPGTEGFQLESVSMHRLAASSPSAFLKALHDRTGRTFQDPKLAKLQELIDSKPNERFLIFTEFRETAEYISRNIPGRLVLQTSGSSNLEHREANAFLFRETESSVMIMTPVGSEGLDYQFCSNLVNYDLHWNPMKIEQRIGRIDRIGQKKKIVSIYNFHVIGSIDERVREVMGNKLDLVSGTFADVPSIVKSSDKLSQSLNSKFVISKEKEAANQLVKTAKFYNQTHSEDRLVIDKVNLTNCEFGTWVNLDWTTQFPWNHETNDWHESLESQSRQFSELLLVYGGQEVAK